MSTLIVAIAQYLLYVLVAIAALVWLTSTSRQKAVLTVEAILGLAAVGIGILVAAHLHTDPRPFVHDPSSSGRILVRKKSARRSIPTVGGQRPQTVNPQVRAAFR